VAGGPQPVTSTDVTMKARKPVDIAAAIAAASQRDMPCICERQHDPDHNAELVLVDVSEARGVPIYHVECRTCWREWRRIIQH